MNENNNLIVSPLLSPITLFLFFLVLLHPSLPYYLLHLSSGFGCNIGIKATTVVD